jgi:guanylate kinase
VNKFRTSSSPLARYGKLFVVSAPSGAGKKTVLDRLLAQDPQLTYSVSATTRDPRPGEVDGKEYYFLDRAEFERRVTDGAFVEWAEVHGNLYGTLRTELERLRSSGKDVVLEIDVQGMRNLKRDGLDAATIFIMPPSLAELERRLNKRGTNNLEDIAVRLRNARDEIAARGEYDHVVVNDEVGRAAEEMKQIIAQYRTE